MQIGCQQPQHGGTSAPKHRRMQCRGKSRLRRGLDAGIGIPGGASAAAELFYAFSWDQSFLPPGDTQLLGSSPGLPNTHPFCAAVLPAHVPVGRRATQASRGAGVECLLYGTENPMPVLYACICLQNLFNRHVKAFKNVTKCPFSIL